MSLLWLVYSVFSFSVLLCCCFLLLLLRRLRSRLLLVQKQQTLDHVRGPFSDSYTEGRVENSYIYQHPGTDTYWYACSIPEHR